MLENSTRIFVENLARAMDRRSFLKKSGETTFLALAALAAGHSISVYADGKQQPNIVCNPPGPYCSVNGVATDGCHGASCFQHMISGQVYQCKVFYQFFQYGCWTNPVSGGYWTCCDCECLNARGQRLGTCGCAQLSTSPVPRPDSPEPG